jgi:hypothetical protein
MPTGGAGFYGVRFLSAGAQVGTGIIDWDGTKERGLGDLPTVAQVEARTKPTADYFDPATDAVATVTNLTNLPTMPTDWLTSVGLSAGAVTEIQAGLSTLTAANVRTESDAALFAVGVTGTVTGRIDAAISTRSTYDGSDTAGTITLASRLTSTRAGYLDTIPNLLTAAAYTAPLTALQTEVAVGNVLIDYDAATGTDLAALLTSAAYTASLPTNFSDLAITATTGLVTSTNTGSGATPAEIWGYTTRTLTSTALSAADVWGYSGRTLDGTQAANLTAIASIPTNPLLTIDTRLDTLDAAISSRLASMAYTAPLDATATATAVGTALTAYDAATGADLTPIITHTTRLDGLIEDSLGDRFTAKALELAPTGSGSGDSAAAIYSYFTEGTRPDPFKATGFSTYDGSDTTGTAILLTRLTSDRAGYLDKLNVTGTLAHSDAAATYRADVSGLLTAAAYTAPLDAAATQAATAAALAAYTVPTLAQAQAAGFTSTRHDALISAESAARAVADGRFMIDYANSRETQYSVDGSVRTVFEIYDRDGNLATTPEGAVDRRPV